MKATNSYFWLMFLQSAGNTAYTDKFKSSKLIKEENRLLKILLFLISMHTHTALQPLHLLSAIDFNYFKFFIYVCRFLKSSL